MRFLHLSFRFKNLGPDCSDKFEDDGYSNVGDGEGVSISKD